MARPAGGFSPQATRGCFREDVLGQVITPSLLHVGTVFARRLHYREPRLGKVTLASATWTVRLASGGTAGGVNAAARYPARRDPAHRA